MYIFVDIKIDTEHLIESIRYATSFAVFTDGQLFYVGVMSLLLVALVVSLKFPLQVRLPYTSIISSVIWAIGTSPPSSQ